MLRSIVVPLDGTPQGERALPCAETVAGATGAALHLVRVRPAGASGGAMTAYPHEGTGLPPAPQSPGEGGEGDYLEGVGQRVAGHLDTAVEWALLDGEVIPCLAAYIREVGADGVILATRAPGALGRMLLGSTTDELIRAVDVPVLAIPARVEDEGSAPPCGAGPILVALDGSEASEVVVPTVARLAPLMDARVTLLHVLPSEASGALPFHLTGDWEQTMRDGERYLDRIRDRLRRRRIRTDTIVMAHPSPSRAICEVAEEIDAGLVAVGTHGRSGLRRALLGSVTRSVVGHGHRPVLVQHPS